MSNFDSKRFLFFPVKLIPHFPIFKIENKAAALLKINNLIEGTKKEKIFE